MNGKRYAGFAFTTPEEVDELLAKSSNERSDPTDSGPSLSDAHAMAEQWALNAQLVVTLMRGDFDRSRDLAHELVERCPSAVNGHPMSIQR